VITAIKIIYRVVKLIYFLAKAFKATSAASKATGDNQKEKNGEKWELWGKAAGSGVRLILVIAGVGRRKRRMK